MPEMSRCAAALVVMAVVMVGADRRPLLADKITFTSQGKTLTVDGNVLAKDILGNMQFEGRDSQHYFIRSGDLVTHETSEEPVALLAPQQLRIHMEKELGGGFKFIMKKHYLVCYSCSYDYAKEAGELFERAYAVFTNYFRNKGGFKLQEPRQPMIAIICGTRDEYIERVQGELGPFAAQTAGVYMMQSNRMYMYDAFGGEVGNRLNLASRVNQEQAEGIASLIREQNISVVVHEAVHQIAYNTGFHNRNVPNPLWLVEGMAMFFESPDLDSKSGWRGVGNVNRERLAQFRKNFTGRSKDSLQTLIADDQRFREAATANDAYAEAWAFTYFLAKSKTAGYVRYLKILNERDPRTAGEYTPEERVRDFKTAFGKSPSDIELDFKRYISSVMSKD